MPGFGAGAIKAGEAFVTLSIENLLDKQMTQADIQLKKRAAAMTKSFRIIGAIVAASAAGLTIATKRAGDLEESINAVDVIFGKASKSMKRFSNDLLRSLGRARTETLRASAQLGGFFTGAGFNQEDAAALSRQVQARIVDIGSLFNIPDADAARRVLSGLSGEIEPLRRLGVNLRQVAVEQELLSMGIQGGFKAATEQQRIIARLNIIMRQTSSSQGDAARTAQSFANRVKALSGAWDEFLVKIGQDFQRSGAALINVMIDLLHILGTVIRVLSIAVNSFLKIAAVITKVLLTPLRILADILGFVLDIFTALDSFLGGAITSLAGMVVVVKLLALAWTKATAAIVAYQQAQRIAMAQAALGNAAAGAAAGGGLLGRILTGVAGAGKWLLKAGRAIATRLGPVGMAIGGAALLLGGRSGSKAREERQRRLDDYNAFVARQSAIAPLRTHQVSQAINQVLSTGRIRREAIGQVGLQDARLIVARMQALTPTGKQGPFAGGFTGQLDRERVQVLGDLVGERGFLTVMLEKLNQVPAWARAPMEAMLSNRLATLGGPLTQDAFGDAGFASQGFTNNFGLDVVGTRGVGPEKDPTLDELKKQTSHLESIDGKVDGGGLR